MSEMLCADGGESRVLDPLLSKRRAKGPYSSMGDEIRQMEPQRGLKHEEIRLKAAAEALLNDSGCRYAPFWGTARAQAPASGALRPGGHGERGGKGEI